MMNWTIYYSYDIGRHLHTWYDEILSVSSDVLCLDFDVKITDDEACGTRVLKNDRNHQRRELQVLISEMIIELTLSLRTFSHFSYSCSYFLIEFFIIWVILFYISCVNSSHRPVRSSDFLVFELICNGCTDTLILYNYTHLLLKRNYLQVTFATDYLSVMMSVRNRVQRMRSVSIFRYVHTRHLKNNLKIISCIRYLEVRI